MWNTMLRSGDNVFVLISQQQDLLPCTLMGDIEKMIPPEITNYSGQKFCSSKHGFSVWLFAVAVVAWNSVWGSLEHGR